MSTIQFLTAFLVGIIYGLVGFILIVMMHFLVLEPRDSLPETPRIETPRRV